MDVIKKEGDYYFGYNTNLNKKYILPVLPEDIFIHQISLSDWRKLIIWYQSYNNCLIFRKYDICNDWLSKTVQRTESLKTINELHKKLSCFQILTIILGYNDEMLQGVNFDQPKYHELADKLEEFLNNLK